MKNILVMPQPPPARFNPRSLPKYILLTGIVWIAITFLIFVFYPFISPAVGAGIVVFLSLSFIGTVAWFAYRAGVAYRRENQRIRDELGAALELAQQARTRTDAVIDAIGDAISIQGPDFRVLYQNSKHREIAGDHAGELCYQAYAGQDSVCEGCHVARSFQDGMIHKIERQRPGDEGTRYFEIISSPLKDGDGTVIACIEAAREVTDYKRAVEAARSSEMRYRALFENAGDAIFILEAEGDRAGMIVDANPAAAAMHGYSLQEILAMHIGELDTPDAADEIPGRLRRILAGEWIHDEITHRRKDGSVFPVEIAAGLLDIENHKFILAFDRDISERRAAEEFRKNILEAVDEAFIVVDRDYRVVSVNAAYCRQVKRPAEYIVGRYCYEISHHRDHPCWLAGEDCTVKLTFETGEPSAALHTHTDSIGNPVYVETRSYPMKNAAGEIGSAIEIIKDITAKRKLEEQLRHAQKMEAVGTLTGGIAHDFNNILTAILGYASVFQKRMKEDDPLRPAMDHIFTAARRASNLTRSLLAFSRKQAIRSAPEDLNEIVRHLEKLLLRIIGEDVELVTDLAADELTVLADRGQMEQVLMNLCTNARDAMPDGGVLTISTNREHLDDERALTHGLEKPGEYVVLAVTDTGTGMDENTREKIFDPFFTTKEVGKGTGLGLSIAYGIVRQHGGAIEAVSDLGRGATFRIYLPATVVKPESARPRSESGVRGGTETVLVAEDSEDVRVLVKNTLKELGYTVIEAVDGDDAVKQFERHGSEVKLLIFDVIMPKKNGREAYNAIRAIMPDIKVLFMSGYTADILARKGVVPEGSFFLAKPLMPDELANKVRDILDHRP